MPPIAIAAGIAAGGSIAGGLIAKSGANSAAQSATAAATQANALQEKMFNQSRTDLAPWTGTGAASLGRLSYLLGLNAPTAGNTMASFNSNYGPQGSAPSSTVGSGSGTLAQLAQRNRPPSIGNASSMMPGTDFSTVGQVGGVGRGSADQSALIDRQGLTANDFVSPMSITEYEARGADRAIGNRSDYSGNYLGRLAAGSTPQASASGTNDGQFGSLMHDFALSDFQTDPGYNFRLGEGAQALDRSAAARGVLGSGGFLKDLTKYNQDFASNEFGNAYNRYQNNRSTKYNFLANLAGMGQTSQGTIANLGNQYAVNAGNNNIAAAGIGASARSSAYGNLAQGIQGAGSSLADIYLYGKRN